MISYLQCSCLRQSSKRHSNMEWTTGIVLILSTLTFTGALLHGHSNASSSSNGHTDPDVYKQLLLLETRLYRELATLRDQNLQLQKTSEELQQQQQKQQQLIQTLNHTIQNLEDSLRDVKSENGVMKEKLDNLNSTFCKQNYSDVDGVTKKIELQTQTLSLAIMELNKSSSEDTQALRNIIRSREQEVMKNVTSAINSLKMQNRYLSLSLLDVQNNTSTLESWLQQQQRTQAEQHKLTQTGIQNLTYLFNNSTAKLSSSLSSLQTRVDSKVAFTAGLRYNDNLTFSPGQTVIFKQIINQVGGGYDPTTGVFTAPKSGLYLIFCTVVAQNHEFFRTKIMINGSVKAGVMAYIGSSSLYIFQSASNLVVHQLQVGGRVWIQVESGSHLYSYYPETTFSVIMINGSG